MPDIMKKENSHPANFGSVVDQIFQQNLSRFFQDDLWPVKSRTNQSVPVNIQETDSSYEMEVIAPGANKEDFRLQISDNKLGLQFEHTDESNGENKERGWLKQEYQKRSFFRSFYLDDTVDSSKIQARYDKGILYITIPKKETAKRISRNIQVN